MAVAHLVNAEDFDSAADLLGRFDFVAARLRAAMHPDALRRTMSETVKLAAKDTGQHRQLVSWRRFWAESENAVGCALTWPRSLETDRLACFIMARDRMGMVPRNRARG